MGWTAQSFKGEGNSMEEKNKSSRGNRLMSEEAAYFLAAQF